MLAACKKDEFTLDRPLSKTDLKFRIEQDLTTDPGGNTVILISETPGVIPVWDYGTGRSNKFADTVKYAFSGDYTVKFAALSNGSLIEADPVVVNVKTNNFNYVTGEEYVNLTGGPNTEKVWLLDVDGKQFAGPITFANPDNPSEIWWDPGASTFPDIMTKGDYGMMSFSLKGGPYFNNHKLMDGGVKESGTFSLDYAARRLTINNATILRGYKPAKDGVRGVSDWQNYYILSLTKDALRLGVIRDKDVDGEGKAMLVYNFISKEYSDNWVPEEKGPDEGYNPEFNPGELLTMLTGTSATGQMWLLDAKGNPVDWIAKGIGWTTGPASSDNWGWNAGWTEIAGNSWIIFDKIGGRQNYTRNQSGVISQGSFSINEAANEIVLVNNTLIQNPASWMNPTATRIKVVKAFPGKAAERGIWLGTSYDAAKDEWVAFHYVIAR